MSLTPQEIIEIIEVEIIEDIKELFGDDKPTCKKEKAVDTQTVKGRKYYRKELKKPDKRRQNVPSNIILPKQTKSDLIEVHEQLSRRVVPEKWDDDPT